MKSVVVTLVWMVDGSALLPSRFRSRAPGDPAETGPGRGRGCSAVSSQGLSPLEAEIDPSSETRNGETLAHLLIFDGGRGMTSISLHWRTSPRNLNSPIERKAIHCGPSVTRCRWSWLQPQTVQILVGVLF